MKKPREMVTGPEAFENFKRLMTALLGVPKAKVVKAKAAKRRTKQPATKRRGAKSPSQK